MPQREDPSPANNWREPIDIEDTVHEHGQRSTYVCHKCRCDECTQANAEYSYEFYWKSRKNRKNGVTLTEYQEILKMAREGQDRSRIR